jgi:adenine phosphoribosyltransferase
MNMNRQNLLDLLPVIADFPAKGVMFRDISPLLANATAFSFAIEEFANEVNGFDFDFIVGAEARGFVFGAALALQLKKGLILARKPNKLPTKTIKQAYGLEYGSDSLEIEADILPKGARVLLLDDVIATGGTLTATAQLIEHAGAKVAGVAALLSIDFLGGTKLLESRGFVVKNLLNI